MSEIRKVSFSSGAEWLLGGFRLLGNSPFGLGLLGLFMGLISLVFSLIILAMPVLTVGLMIILVVLQPVLLAGIAYAAREVDLGRPALPGHLFQAFAEGRALSILGALLLPQLAAMLILGVLFFIVIGGTGGMERLIEISAILQTNPNPDPSVFQGFPAFGLFLFMLVALAIGVAIFLLTFTVTPQIMFEGKPAIEALRHSLSASLRNIGAVLLFVLLVLFIAFLMLVGLQIVGTLAGALVGYVAGPAVGQTINLAFSALFSAIFMPVYVGATYFAWKQMFSTPTAPGDTGNRFDPPSGGIEV